MWKGVLGIGGFVAGAVLTVALVQFASVYIVLMGGLLIGTIGTLIGMAIDARALMPKVIFGALGFVLGAPLGGVLVGYVVSFRDTFSGGGLAGLFIGVPVGALLGCAFGICLASRFATRSPERPNEAEPDAPADGGRGPRYADLKHEDAVLQAHEKMVP